MFTWHKTFRQSDGKLSPNTCSSQKVSRKCTARLSDWKKYFREIWCIQSSERKYFIMFDISDFTQNKKLKVICQDLCFQLVDTNRLPSYLPSFQVWNLSKTFDLFWDHFKAFLGLFTTLENLTWALRYGGRNQKVWTSP